VEDASDFARMLQDSACWASVGGARVARDSLQRIVIGLAAGALEREAPPDRGALVRARDRLSELFELLLTRATIVAKRRKIKAFTYQVITKSMESQTRATGRDESSSQILVDGKPWVWSEVDPLLTPRAPSRYFAEDS
jgi:hypothetical protein